MRLGTGSKPIQHIPVSRSCATKPDCLVVRSGAKHFIHLSTRSPNAPHATGCALTCFEQFHSDHSECCANQWDCLVPGCPLDHPPFWLSCCISLQCWQCYSATLHCLAWIGTWRRILCRKSHLITTSICPCRKHTRRAWKPPGEV